MVGKTYNKSDGNRRVCEYFLGFLVEVCHLGFQNGDGSTRTILK
jgi:hypothetical protein